MLRAGADARRHLAGPRLPPTVVGAELERAAAEQRGQAGARVEERRAFAEHAQARLQLDGERRWARRRPLRVHHARADAANLAPEEQKNELVDRLEAESAED